MFLTILIPVLAFVAGVVSAYFFLRNNPKKTAVVNQTVTAVGAVASTVAADISSAAKKL